jgi:hypothetical protein
MKIFELSGGKVKVYKYSLNLNSNWAVWHEKEKENQYNKHINSNKHAIKWWLLLLLLLLLY